jgi:hypothetical protein
MRKARKLSPLRELMNRVADGQWPPKSRDGSSTPSRKERFGFDHLVGRAGEVEFKFSGLAGDENLDGVQTAGDHTEAELFVDFAESMLLEAFAHVGASVQVGRIAT